MLESPISSSKQNTITLENMHVHNTENWFEGNHAMQILTSASKIVNLVVSVSKCVLPTSTVFPYNDHNFTLIMNYFYQQTYSYIYPLLLICVQYISHTPSISISIH